MKRSASAAWTGGLKNGQGQISTQSKALDAAPYGFKTRFDSAPGTNPEELIAAAHAGCFTMALVAKLEQAGLAPERIQTSAAVTLDKDGSVYSISAVHLELLASIPDAKLADLEKFANLAKVECPVSKLLNATITLSMKLEA
jgi:osmotically inducible protein OsmC